MIKRFWLPVFVFLFSVPAIAAEPEFILPLNCKPDQNCWVVKYVDVDPSPNAHRDFMCGPVTSEEHKGVDFAIRSRGDMHNGVDVYAAMDGTVSRVREGESDTVKTEEEFQAIKDARKECGNAVLIDHNNQGHGNLNTLYCHLKKGSITVKPGDSIKAGQKIAEVGQSGYAQFPHLHFGVVRDGGVVDPYTGLSSNKGCGQFKQNMWQDNLAYDPIIIFHGGFRDKEPDFTAIKEGQANPETLNNNGEAIIYWAGFYQAVKDDEINMSIADPSGKELASRDIIIDKNRKEQSFYYIGRELNGKILPSGTYVGKTTYTRKGYPPKTAIHTVLVP